MPELRRVTRADAAQAEGIVIAIDVIRAFTVAAYAFAGGATSLWLVKEPAEAFALRERDPQALLAGEIGGRLIPGFDLNNSPYVMTQANVRGRRIIQRTGAGTQGAVSARNASHLLLGSLVNARATATYARQLSQASDLPITFLPTASLHPSAQRNEDEYCADYMEALLTEHPNAPDLLKERVQRLFEADRFAHWGSGMDLDFPEGDLELILAVDSLDFVMVGVRQMLLDFPCIEVTQVTLQD